MELDSAPPVVQLQSVQAEVRSDGLLLYVAQAAYEPGTSPLSNWVPLRAYQTRAEEQEGGASVAESPLDVFERCVLFLVAIVPMGTDALCAYALGRLVRRRLSGPAGISSVPEIEMDP